MKLDVFYHHVIEALRPDKRTKKHSPLHRNDFNQGIVGKRS